MQRVNQIVRNEINLSAASTQHMVVSLGPTVALLKIVRCGSATAHGGKPPAYRRLLKNIQEALPQAQPQKRENGSAPESQRLSAMCCGKAAKRSVPPASAGGIIGQPAA